jgi:Bifunctional DNA primase/polymerase, N-terminal
MTTNPILRRALGYAAAGWPVFPCVPGQKVPATAHGCHDATTDPGQIARWWQQGPDRNLAIATGRPGPDVLDVDHHGEHGNGYAALARLREAGLVPAPAAVIRTPGGGLHLYFTGTQQGNGKLPRHHVDYRAAGGYVLAPPSQVAGRPYQVIACQPAASHAFDWQAARDLLDPSQPALRRQPAGPGHDHDLEHLAAWVARQEHGNRNDGLYWATSRAAEQGLLDHDAIERLVGAALRSGLRGGEREARATIALAMRGRGLDPFAGRQAEAG